MGPGPLLLPAPNPSSYLLTVRQPWLKPMQTRHSMGLSGALD
jgi:hypothetical protein